jgi:hypothetical protein
MSNIKKIIKTTILEGISIDNGMYSIDRSHDKSDDIIKLGDGISSNIDTMYNNKVLSGLVFNDKTDKRKFINDLKWGDKIPSNIIDYVINLAVINLNKQINLSSYDFIIAPKSSSDINIKLLEELERITNAEVISDFFVKNEVNKIWLDLEQAKEEGSSNKFIKKLVKRFEFSKGIEGQSVKLQPLNRFERKYLKDFLIVNNRYHNVISDMVDSKVLVVDDMFSTGRTIEEMSRILGGLGIGELTLFTLFS